MRHATPAPVVPAWRVFRAPPPRRYSFQPGISPRPVLLSLVADVTGVTVKEILSRSRHRRIVRARHIYCYAARTVWDFSFPRIGRHLGLDHSTVLHGVKKVMEHRFPYEPHLLRVLAAIRKGRMQ